MAPSGASTRRVYSRREVVNILSAAAVVILSALPILGAHRIVSQQHTEVSPGQLTVLELLESIPQVGLAQAPPERPCSAQLLLRRSRRMTPFTAFAPYRVVCTAIVRVLA